MARNALVLLVVVAGLMPLPARAADAPRPLRMLTFDCSVSVTDQRETPADTRSSHMVMMGREQAQVESPASGAGEAKTTTTQAAKGSINVSVLSATDDAGLVVEVAENAETRTRPAVKLAIGPEGSLFYDPSSRANLTEEEIAVVRWMARGFYGDRPREPGTSWTVDQSNNGRTDVERYHVTAHDRDRVTLDYALEEKTQGTTGYDATRTGSLVYDTALVVPVKATFESSSRSELGATMSVVHSSITLTLTADSFGRPHSR